MISASLQIDSAKREIQPLLKEHEEAQKRYNTANEQTIEYDKIISTQKELIKKNGSKFNSHDDGIETLLHELRTIDNDRANLEEDAELLRTKIETVKKQAATFTPLDELMEEHHRAKEDHKALLPQYQASKRKYENLDTKRKEIRQEKHRIQRDLQKTLDVKAQRHRKVFQRFSELKTAYEWIRQNRKDFRKPVIGPICCEVNPESELAAAYVEQHVPNATWKSFIVQDKADYDLIYRELRDKLKVPVNLIQIGNISPPQSRLYSDEVMEVLKRDHGVLGYLDELYQADDLVAEALRSTASTQKVLVGNEHTQKSMDDGSLGELLTQPKDRGGNLRGYCIFTRSKHESTKYTCIISRYSGGPAIREDTIKPAKLLMRGDDDKKKGLQDKLAEANASEQSVEQKINEMEEEAKDLTLKNQEANTRVKEISEDIRNVKKLQNKIDTLKAKLAELEEELSHDDEEKKANIKKQLAQRVNGALKAVKAQSDSQKQILLTLVRTTGAYLNKETASADESRTRYVLLAAIFRNLSDLNFLTHSIICLRPLSG